MDKEQFAKSLLAMATTDLESSEVLLDRKLYPQALFAFQQSVEKANKSLGVVGDFLLPEESKQMGHSQISLFKKMVDIQINNVKVLTDNQVDVQQLAAVISNHSGKNIDDFLKQLEEAKHIKSVFKDLDIFNCTEETLLEDLEEIEENADISFDLSSERLSEVEVKVREGFGTLYNELKQISPVLTIEEFEQGLNEDDDFSKFLNQMILNQLETLEVFIKTFIPLLHLGFMSEKLVRVRYPELETGFDPQVLLTGQHPLVKHLPRMLAVLQECISGLEQIISRAQKDGTTSLVENQ